MPPETTMKGMSLRLSRVMASAAVAENCGMLKSERITSQVWLSSAARIAAARSTRFQLTSNSARCSWRTISSASSGESSTTKTRMRRLEMLTSLEEAVFAHPFSRAVAAEGSRLK